MDENECDYVIGGNDCHRFATCKNIAGSYTCQCDEGLTGNSYSSRLDISDCYGLHPQLRPLRAVHRHRRIVHLRVQRRLVRRRLCRGLGLQGHRRLRVGPVRLRRLHGRGRRRLHMRVR